MKMEMSKIVGTGKVTIGQMDSVFLISAAYHISKKSFIKFISRSLGVLLPLQTTITVFLDKVSN